MKRKISTVFGFLFTFQVAIFAKASGDIKCEAELAIWLKNQKLETQIDRVFPVAGWIRISESHPDSRRYRRHLANSQWIDVDVELKSCQVSLLRKHEPPSIGKATEQKYFTDASLKKRASGKKLSLIYVWSPKMIYSITEMSVAQNIAKKLKMDFVSVVDQSEEFNDTEKRKLASLGVAESSVQHSFLSQSNYLTYSNQVIHYPKIFLVGKNKISEEFIAGVMPEKIWMREIKAWSKDF